MLRVKERIIDQLNQQREQLLFIRDNLKVEAVHRIIDLQVHNNVHIEVHHQVHKVETTLLPQDRVQVIVEVLHQVAAVEVIAEVVVVHLQEVVPQEVQVLQVEVLEVEDN